MKKWLYIIGGFLLLNILVAGLSIGAFFWKFSAKIPQANFSPPANATEARHQDLDYLLNLTERDKSFSDEEAAQFKSRISEMRSEADELTDGVFAMKIAKAVALTENGHTNVRIAYLADDLNSLPVRFFWFADGLYIVRAHEEYSDLLGARVIEYGGMDPDILVTRLETYYGGNRQHVRVNSPYFFGSPAMMQGAGLITNPDSVKLLIKTIDGEQQEVTLPVEENLTETTPLRNHPLPLEIRNERESGNQWAFLDAEKISSAHYAMHPEKNAWTSELPNGGIYVRIRIVLNKDDVPLEKWLSDVRQRYKSSPASYLVLDLRSNPGGDYTISRKFASKIVDLVGPDGKIYLLTDGGTFSAAVVTAAFAKHSGDDRSVFVGSDMGDEEQFWAESGGQLILPNSGVRVSVSTGYHDWENGCKDWSKCYWLNIVTGVAAGKLDTDLIAPLSFRDYIRGVDTTVQSVLDAEGIEK